MDELWDDLAHKINLRWADIAIQENPSQDPNAEVDNNLSPDHKYVDTAKW